MTIRLLFPYVGDSVGGSHISSSLLIRNLDPAQYEAEIVLHQEGPLTEFLAANGLTWRSLPMGALAGENPSLPSIAIAQLKAAPRLIAYIKKHKIDLVHTNDLRTHLTWGVAARLAGKPWVWHQRVLMSDSWLWRLMPWIASQVISISYAVAASLPPLGSLPSAVAHNPVDLAIQPDRNKMRAVLGREADIAKRAVIVGYVGNMTVQKRPLTFIRTAAEINRQSGLDVQFVMFGDDRGGQLNSAKDLVRRLGLDERFYFAGHRAPIEPWLAGLDVLLAPGVKDGFGRTLIEAMMVQTAVVAADSGGHPEIIEHGQTGLLAPPDDHYAMSVNVIQLLRDNSLRGKMAQRGKEFTMREFSAQSHAQKIMNIYSRIIRTV
jgi:glycosyltransferase involved in cell wall biosynthesis